MLLVSGVAFSQAYKDSKQPVEKRIKSILSQMTLEEKIDYLGGANDYYIRAIPRLGIPAIKTSDGPVGSRNDGKSTAYPATVLAASTWNVSLLKELGEALASDCHARGVHILLAPGVNICRAPMGGRNFEYMGEDPYLAGRMAVAYIKGLQGKGVAGCIKHYAGNEQEWDRNKVSSNIDERTFQEIYLPAFKAAVKEGKVATAMDSYNLLNGEHATQNSHLNNDILKKMWGFDGILMSDWGATYDGIAAAKGGLDLEMGSGDHMNRATLIPAIKNGVISESLIDEKVSRILRIIFRYGFYDRSQQDKRIPLDNPASANVALKVAREGVVLLKNEGNILPLNDTKIKKIAVVGPNANQYVFGGGSSQTMPFHCVTTYEGIKNLVGNKVSVDCVSESQNVGEMIQNAVFYADADCSAKGLKGEYFNNMTLSGDPAFKRTDEKIDFNWGTGTPNSDVKDFPSDGFSVRWTGFVRSSVSSVYTFVAKGDDGYRLWVNGKLVIDGWRDQPATQQIGAVAMEAGKTYEVKLEYYDRAGGAEIHLGWADNGKSIAKAVQTASSADVAVVCVGFNGEFEQEGQDRKFELPGGQSELINAVAKANPNTIVILNGGGNIYMQPWLANVKGLLHGWYTGQEGGTALAEILFGKVNPSGKLPDTFEKEWSDNPTHDSYYDTEKQLNVTYKEGLLVGYRYYDTKKVKPQFPFGYGLSYTTFAYANMVVSKNGSHAATGSVLVKNIGKRDGYEVVQVYVKPLAPSVTRPVHELKAFKKVFVKAGQTVKVDFTLDDSSFSYFDVQKNSWVVDHGQYEIQAGTNSRDILATAKVVY
ncbi:MAG: glycoside hydrolase family 3 C-terminal domain-containing protein [Bacteroidota bacterium]|nr:glycoside hydrolase family 3 C-terminal domain-containing protein [Bacteroidota bacterium]